MDWLGFHELVVLERTCDIAWRLLPFLQEVKRKKVKQSLRERVEKEKNGRKSRIRDVTCERAKTGRWARKQGTSTLSTFRYPGRSGPEPGGKTGEMHVAIETGEEPSCLATHAMAHNLEDLGVCRSSRPQW